MVNFLGKLRGEGPPKRVRIVWTAGWVEPGDNLMMVTILHLSAAPKGQSPQICTVRQCGTSTYEFFSKMFY